MSGTRYFFQILMKFEISRPILEKLSKIKCYENIFTWSITVLCGRTYGQTDR